jgi:FAD/FMN-containing dehydrogenase
MWALREAPPLAVKQLGEPFYFDVSLPLTVLYELVEVLRERLAPLGALVVGFGHLGDGNLHMCVAGNANLGFSCFFLLMYPSSSQAGQASG